MIDNYQGQENSGLADAMEKWKEEKEEARRTIKIRLWVSLFAIAIGTAGLACIAWFDWRISLGMFLVSWSENIARKNKQ